MADRGRSRSRSPPTYLSVATVPLAIAQDPAGHNQVMWLVKEHGAFRWYQEEVYMRDQLEKQYQQGIGIEHSQLTLLSNDGSDVLTHYHTHDLSKKPWTQTRFWYEHRKREAHSREIVRVLK